MLRFFERYLIAWPFHSFFLCVHFSVIPFCLFKKQFGDPRCCINWDLAALLVHQGEPTSLPSCPLSVAPPGLEVHLVPAGDNFYVDHSLPLPCIPRGLVWWQCSSDPSKYRYWDPLRAFIRGDLERTANLSFLFPFSSVVNSNPV